MLKCVEWRWTILNSVGKCSKILKRMLKGAEGCWNMVKDVRICWHMFEDGGIYWTMFETCWNMLHTYCKVQKGVGIVLKYVVEILNYVERYLQLFADIEQYNNQHIIYHIF